MDIFATGLVFLCLLQSRAGHNLRPTAEDASVTATEEEQVIGATTSLLGHQSVHLMTRGSFVDETKARLLDWPCGKGTECKQLARFLKGVRRQLLKTCSALCLWSKGQTSSS